MEPTIIGDRAPLDDEDSTYAIRAANDARAFAALYDKYFSRVYNYVCYRVVDPHAADDIVADVFERALTKIGSYCPTRGSFAAWLFAIARNAANYHLRVQRRRQWLRLDTLLAWRHEDPLPEEVVVNSQDLIDLLQAIRALDDRQREVIGLRYGAGFTNRHIAELTGLSEGNVAVILHRALARLRMALGTRGGKHEQAKR
jgi:RNA polymerase sigma factor (sigma-70 family)